jgi:hypothetical protein
LALARADAEQVYGDLDAYTVTVAQRDDGAWTVDYEPAPGTQGGGPHYVIVGGEIVKKRYEQ